MTLEVQAKRARDAARILARATSAQKDHALIAIADQLLHRSDEIVRANGQDVLAAHARGTAPALIDRLTLTSERITAIADGVRKVAGLADPVGTVLRASTTDDGLDLKQVRVPFGVVGMIYEARPNVTVDAAVLCLKSGNAVLLRGSASAAATNTLLVEIMRSALMELAVDAVQLIAPEDRENVRAMVRARGLIDVVIPRGGADLIDLVVAEATVPVIETGVGNCHVYVDRAADLAKAVPIVVNSKVSRPSVCNAAETLLIHAEVADAYLPEILRALASEGVRLHGDATSVQIASGCGVDVDPASEADWRAEYGSLDLAVAVVRDLTAAIEHIRTYSTGHTEAIVTEDTDTAAEFIAGCDSAAIMVNASTRFTDGEKFGFGAEIGISTQKLHARGPMALPELTTTTWIVTGTGQIRS